MKNSKKTTKTFCACIECHGDCWGCWHADSCGEWLDKPELGIPTVAVEVEDYHASMSLCEGRHEIPQAVDGAIFDNEVNPLATSALERIAGEKLHDVTELDLYVTGLTVALVAVLNVCHASGIKVTLYHFDRNSGEYYPQAVV